MGSVAHPKFIQIYIQLAIQYGLPLMLPRYSEDEWIAYGGIDPQAAAMAAHLIQNLEDMGIPLLDGLAGLELVDPRNRFDQLKSALATIKTGITHFIIHPSKDTPELRAITSSWACRVADYQTFSDEETCKYINEKGIHIIGYKALKELIVPETL
jgi:hypothetical protein